MMLKHVFLSLRQFGFGNQRTVPSLDGLRAISIAFVVIAHLTATRNFPLVLFPLANLGEFGVRIFFVISGFLITSVLLKELRRTNTISLGRFYFRRTMRLFPASYFYILVIAVLAAKHLVSLKRWDLLFAMTYTMNYHEARGWSLGHLWSLGVEEQFYLLWPIALLMLRPLRSVRFLIAILVAAPFLRLASPYAGTAFNFLIWSDALATGCLLAMIREDLASNERYARLLASRWFFLVPVAALAANYVPFTKISWLVSETVMNLCIAASADWAMRKCDTAVGRFLNLPAISFIGVLSYSLYLWQQIFLNRGSTSPYCAFPLNIVLTAGMAMLSYLLIEAPFLRLRSGIECGISEWRETRQHALLTGPINLEHKLEESPGDAPVGILIALKRP
jgi:peptidoglycan/LPS O-acetylase OafA/YrhL